MIIKLYNRDEIFLIDLDKVLYFKAEDHYTNIYYDRDTKLLLPFGLSHLEGLLADVCGSDNVFVRAGRSHLINMHKVVRVSVVKESVTMIGGTDSLVSLHLSKVVVRGLAKNFRVDDAVAANYLWGGGKIAVW